jgi:outer membrane scaffolding protein for murein synthesis (MipA/OmpV family)
LLSLVEATKTAKQLSVRVALGFDVAGEKQERKRTAAANIEEKKWEKPIRMKTYRSIFFSIFIQIFSFSTAAAQENDNVIVPLPSVDDFSKGKNGWSAGLGFGVEYETAYEGSDEFVLEVEPAGGVQWRDGDSLYFFAGQAIGWRGVYEETYLLEALVGFDEGREESDSNDGRLLGLGDQEESTEIVLQGRYTFDADWRYWLVGRVVTGGDGHLGLFGVGRRFGNQSDGTGSELNAVMVIHDSEYADKGFGIDSAQALASGLRETRLNGGLRSIGINYNFRNYLNKNWQVYGEALVEYFAAEVRESPIARGNYEAEVGAGLIRLF